VSEHDVALTVNGKPMSARTDSRMTLADFLRHTLNLTGTHVGCEHGVCGACTVLFNGRSTRSCLTLAVQAHGAEIGTIEGLAAADGTLSPLQQAMIEHHGLQCGFCTPGILMTLTEMMETVDRPDEKAMREWLSGNICRCTGYQGIVDAAMSVLRNAAGTRP
jgi:carbon-monoxide dehydrogenase small subunit